MLTILNLYVISCVVGSAFMLGRALTSVFWGLVADRYGRKPVILISIISVLVLDGVFIFTFNYSLWIYYLYCCSNELACFSPLYILVIRLVLINCFRIIFNTLFGLSKRYWIAIVTRLLLGSLNGLLGPIKVCSSVYLEAYQLQY